MINSNSFLNIDDEKLLNLLKEIIGLKFKLPFGQVCYEKFDNDSFLKKFKLFEYESIFLDEEQEKKI